MNNNTTLVKRLWGSLAALACTMLLASCGGGGGNPGTVNGTSAGASNTPVPIVPTVTVTLVSASGAPANSLTVAGPLTAKALVTGSDGKPVTNTIVSFTGNSTLITMTPSNGSSLTDSNGVASILLSAATPAASGAGTLIATAVIGTANVAGSANYAVVALSPGVLTMSLLDPTGVLSNSVSGNGTLTAKALVVDRDGAPVANALVTFSADNTLAVLQPTTALTDAKGYATVVLRPASTTAAGAGRVSAAVNVGAATLLGTVNYSVAAAPTPTSMVVSFLDANGATSTSVSSGSPLTIKALVTDRNGAPVGNALVTFSTNSKLATIAPTTGTSVTDSAGVALATLRPTDLSVNGAGTVGAAVTVNGTTLTGEANYTVLPSTVSSANVAVSFVDAAGAASNAVTSATPLTARAKVTDKAGLPIASALVAFATDNALAVFSPSNGTSLTNGQGVAEVTLRPASLAASGAGKVTASTVLDGKTLVGDANFMVGATSLTLGPLNLAPASIAAYGSTVVTIDVLAGGAKYADQQMNVNFTSACVTAGKATFASTVATNNGTAQAVYRDQGCANNDLISASVSGVTQAKTATLTIAAPAATSIQFTSADPVNNSIVIKGQGGIGRSETATLKFKVFDIFSNPLPGKTVTFSTNSPYVTINKVSDSTDQNGEVITTVNSGSTPTTFRVQASIGGGITTQSDSIVVTTGQPVQRSMSLSVTTPNVEGWTFDSGVAPPATLVNVLLADAYGNPVPDGTPVTFQTNMGAVGSASKGACNTVNGGCSVDFRTQEVRRPAANTPSTPCNTGAGSSADATRVGLATICASTTDNASVLFRKTTVFFGGSKATNVYKDVTSASAGTKLDGTIFALGDVGSGKFASFTLQLNDVNGNPLPNGTTVAITNGFNMVAVGVVPSTVPKISPTVSSGTEPTGANVLGNQGSTHVVTVGSPLSSSCTGPVDGAFNVTITTPQGTSTIYPFSAHFTCP